MMQNPVLYPNRTIYIPALNDKRKFMLPNSAKFKPFESHNGNPSYAEQ